MTFSDDALTADANLTHIAALKGQLEETERDRDEWREDYERMAGALLLYEDIVELDRELYAYAGIFCNVLLGDLAERERVAQADAAEWEALYTAALVDLHRARAALEQIRDCEGMYEWLDKRHAAGLGVVDLDWVASVAGEALTSDHPGAVSLLTELEAAREFIELQRAWWNAGGEVTGSFDTKLAAYDAAVEARRE